VPAKKPAKKSVKSPPKGARPGAKAAPKSGVHPNDPALSTLLARQEHLAEKFDRTREAHPNDPALSAMLARLEHLEVKLDRLLALAEKGAAPKAGVKAASLSILPPALETADASRLQPADADTAQFLSRTPLFAKLSAQECSMLAVYLEAKTLPKAGPLFQQGDFGDAMYVVRTGALEIYKNDVFGSVRVAEVRPGGLVGEMALVENKPRSANVRASEDSKLLVLSRSAYADLKKVHPQVATKFQDELLLLLSGRLRQTTEKLVGEQASPRS
jgi:CRP/FNR family cyclic AMP-dependent transcriptional regulator